MNFINQLGPTQQFLFFSMLKIVCVVSLLMLMINYAVLVERRLSAFIKDRVGPNRVGPCGIWQPIADGLKFMLKEDYTPAHVRKVYFWLAPAIAMIPALLAIAVIPFGSFLGHQAMVIADLNVGILYTFGIVSLGVYGIVLAGYAANSKYPFLGGIRSSAQMISYEISMGMSVVPLFLLVGSLRLNDVIGYQATNGWLIWKEPLSFVLFLIASFAETNRLPFDLPESETELVSGYHTEYSSLKFGLFFAGEYANVIAAAGMMTTLFLGGWTLPVFGLNQAAGPDHVWLGVAHIGIFLGKVLFLVLVIMWVRWMWPRFRYDQLMNLGWRRFIPLALANIVITAWVLYLRR